MWFVFVVGVVFWWAMAGIYNQGMNLYGPIVIIVSTVIS